MPVMGCDHFDGSRTYEGDWGRRSVRFCGESCLPTRREQDAETFAEMVEGVEPRRNFRLSGGPDRHTVATEIKMVQDGTGVPHTLS